MAPQTQKQNESYSESFGMSSVSQKRDLKPEKKKGSRVKVIVPFNPLNKSFQNCKLIYNPRLEFQSYHQHHLGKYIH